MQLNQPLHLGEPSGLAPSEYLGLGVSVLTDPALRCRLGSTGTYGRSGAATTYFNVDPQKQPIAFLSTQRLPRDDVSGAQPMPGAGLQNLLGQALNRRRLP